jgi:hypothetical protein
VGIVGLGFGMGLQFRRGKYIMGLAGLNCHGNVVMLLRGHSSSWQLQRLLLKSAVLYLSLKATKGDDLKIWYPLQI